MRLDLCHSGICRRCRSILKKMIGEEKPDTTFFELSYSDQLSKISLTMDTNLIRSRVL